MYINLHISISEICQRRKFKDKFTYMAFLDLKKKKPMTLCQFTTFSQNYITLVYVVNAFNSLKTCISLRRPGAFSQWLSFWRVSQLITVFVKAALNLQFYLIFFINDVLDKMSPLWCYCRREKKKMLWWSFRW